MIRLMKIHFSKQFWLVSNIPNLLVFQARPDVRFLLPFNANKKNFPQLLILNWMQTISQRLFALFMSISSVKKNICYLLSQNIKILVKLWNPSLETNYIPYSLLVYYCSKELKNL